jgi:hypothetical protein
MLEHLNKSTSKSVIFHPMDRVRECESKVTLYFHPQQNKQHPGILVDVFSLANGCFLSPENRCFLGEVILKKRFMANSPTAPANKFLILAEGME